MSSSKPSLARREPSEAFVADISKALEDSGRPGVLWGDYLLSVYGVRREVKHVVFLLTSDLEEYYVGDDPKGVPWEALGKLDLHKCRKENCSTGHDGLLFCEPALLEGHICHAHIGKTSTQVIFALQPSNICNLARVTETETGEEISSPYLVTATHPSIPRHFEPEHGPGAFRYSVHPPTIPLPVYFIEAMILVMSFSQFCADRTRRRLAVSHPDIRYDGQEESALLAAIGKNFYAVLNQELFEWSELQEPPRKSVQKFMEGGDDVSLQSLLPLDHGLAHPVTWNPFQV